MKLTEEEVMILEDMKRIESIQEEIESYLIEKYGLENLEEGIVPRWISRPVGFLTSPLTRFKKHYITGKGDVWYTHRDTKLMKKKNSGETLNADEQDRVKVLDKIQQDVRDGTPGTAATNGTPAKPPVKSLLDQDKEAISKIKDAKRDEKFYKKELKSKSKDFDNAKKLDLQSVMTQKKKELVFGDGMDPKKAEKKIKKNIKQYKQDQQDKLKDSMSNKGTVSANASKTERDLVKANREFNSANINYDNAKNKTKSAEYNRESVEDKIKNLRYK